jgi:hypothetical protein
MLLSMDLQLEDLVPQESEFKLRKTGKTYCLREVTAADEGWFQKTFGESLVKRFENLESECVCRIAFRLMVEKDKQEFASQTVTIMNEEGETVEIRLGGWELFMHYVSGLAEKVEISKAVLQAIGVSRPVLDKIEEEEIKKKLITEPTGQSSLTSLHLNMGGPQNTHLVERSKKSTGALKQSTKGRRAR